MRSVFNVFLLSLVLSFALLSAQERPKLATVADALAVPEPPADARIFYGEDSLQFVDLRLPEGPGPFPVAVLVHGGCWLAQYDMRHLGAMAETLTESGIATWTLEFRRVGNDGGGWPGTFQDVSRGTDLLRDAASDYSLDLDRVVLVGHSAGGHLALWLAGRHRLKSDSSLYVEDPLALKGVIGLAPAADLELTFRNQTCGGVSQRLVGGTPEEFPSRYHDGSAAALLPLGLPQVLINGDQDPGWLTVARSYLQKAESLGDPIRLIVPPNAGHFELVMPGSSAFPTVREAIEELLRQ